MQPQRICIIGVGLIGGSFALGLRKAGYSGEIVGAGRGVENLEKAVALGVVNRYETDLSKAVEGAGLVFLAVPMGAMRQVLATIRPALDSDAIITDAGSVKGSFVADAEAVLDDLSRVVPGHPIAGTENSGVQAAFATLYENRKVILTPLPQTASGAVDCVRSLWQMTGAEVECLTPAHHDRVLAATSHLPHVLAFSLVDTLATLQESEEVFRYAASGFHDFTRIASSDPVMWRDICLSNRLALLEMLDRLSGDLAAMRELIDAGDAGAIESIFRRAKQARDEHVQWGRKHS
ncbi:prephenate dehydrogenase/arogenate dehydrogenase family protein [Granulosicoccaceae sp. 1_MG-2023]|nr:prephenate dehydrogenase/arogenate dehydrogenase family protein [Granulosicoccaceae sp. 1_MG-2023]